MRTLPPHLQNVMHKHSRAMGKSMYEPWKSHRERSCIGQGKGVSRELAASGCACKKRCEGDVEDMRAKFRDITSSPLRVFYEVVEGADDV
jgi:hypothetical protein